MTAYEVEWVLETIKANVPTLVASLGWASLGTTHLGAVESDALGFSALGATALGGVSWDNIPLELVDRDDSDSFEADDIRSRSGRLEQNNIVSASLVDRASDPLGYEYDAEVEGVVGIRIEGLHVNQRGHIDPNGTLPPADGEQGAPFRDLVRAVRESLMMSRTYPTTPSPNTDHYTVQITNEAPQSSNYRDYYRHDLDVLLRGDEHLNRLP